MVPGAKQFDALKRSSTIDTIGQIRKSLLIELEKPIEIDLDALAEEKAAKEKKPETPQEEQVKPIEELPEENLEFNDYDSSEDSDSDSDEKPPKKQAPSPTTEPKATD